MSPALVSFGYDRHSDRSAVLFAVTDSLREHPPPLGTVVVYKFQELSHEGTPRFPIYCGVSADKSVAKDAIVRSTQLRADLAAGSASEA